MALTEKSIQRRLHLHFGVNREIGITNIHLFGNESDYLTVTKAGYIDEYEVKISRSDFLRDSKKTRDEAYRAFPGSLFEQEQPPQLAATYETYPNRFWYVVPEGLIRADELPPYAGLIECKPHLRITTKAPMLHKDKVTQDAKIKILMSAYYRYTADWVRKAKPTQEQ